MNKYQASKLYHIKQAFMQAPYAPQAIPDPRDLDEEELEAIRRAKRTFLRGPFASSQDPATKRLASPGLRALASGTVGAGLGGALGAVLGAETGDEGPAAILGALTGGLSAGGLSYALNRKENRDIEDAFTRLPKNPTIRQYELDPLVRDRLLRGSIQAGGRS